MEAEVIEKKEPVIASIGKVQKQEFTIPKHQEITDTNVSETLQANADTEVGKTDTPTKTEAEIAAELKLAEDAKNIQTPPVNEPLKPLTDEELKAEYEKRFPTQAALTDEERQKQADAFEKRMLDLYVDGGGKIEEFALYKQVSAMDLTDISEAELTKELKAIGITDPEQIKAVKKERYFQLEQEDIDAIEDETEKSLAQKKLDFGKAKFENKGKQIKENAVDFLDNLKEAVNQKDFFTKRENDISSNVDEHFSKLERKMTLQLGKVDNTDIAPVEYEVPQDIIDKAREKLNTTAARKQLLFNKDGSLNHTNLADLVLKAEMFESGTASKTAYLEGGHREVEKFEKLFPYRSAAALGLNGAQPDPKGTGKVAGIGKVQRVKMAVNQ